jgi:hypothetical protein
MVALLVVGTIIACLLADGILLSYRERKGASESVTSQTLSPSLVFAQDGGEKIKESEQPKEVKWDGLEKELSNKTKN